MYSMRYGTVPVVRATGGLDDTVRPFDPDTGAGTGFTFHEYRSSAMLVALEAALALYARPARWQTLQQAGMRQDFSWDASAAAYVHEYRKVIDRRREADGERYGRSPQSVSFARIRTAAFHPTIDWIR